MDSAAGSRFREPGAVMGAGAEFDLIREFLRGARTGRTAGVRVGVGDDCAVVGGDGIVLGTDLSIEDVHFRRSWLRPEEIGYRAAAAALSDLAAMAARPIGVLTSLAATPEDAGAFAREIMRGVRAAVEGLGGELLGGDLTRSPGPIVLDMVVVGEAAVPVTRRGALPGDELWVTGELGGSAAAVTAWMAAGEPHPAARIAFAAPTPRTREALWLAARGIPRAMLDVSDGLGGDAAHLAAASEVAVVLDRESIPVHPAAHAGGDAAADLALRGGEDYELLFAARPGTVEAHLGDFAASFEAKLTRVGHVEAGTGVHIDSGAGGRRELKEWGFQHFGGGDDS